MIMSKMINFIIVSVIILFSSVSFAETVWIDVRSAQEYLVDNIKGDLRVSHTDIVKQVSALYPNKDTEIRLYCRSGRRAEKAMSALKELGYKNVSNAGGIADAREERKL